MTRPPLRRALDAASVLVFLVALAAPSVDRVLRPDEVRDARHENRAPAPSPRTPRSASAAIAWPAEVDAWFRDTSGLRDVLIGTRNAISASAGLAPTRLLEPGADGWLFYRGEGVLAAQRGAGPGLDEQAATWSRALVARGRRWSALGSRLVFALVPDKEAIYPERLSAAWSRVGPTPQDLLLDALRGSPDVEALDLRPALVAAKSADQPAVEDHVYFPRGTHWTSRGACAAHAVLARAIRPASPPRVACDTWDRATEPAQLEDSWYRNLFLLDRLVPSFRLAPPADALAWGGAPVAVHGQTVAGTRDPALPSVYFVHDSQGPFVHPFLAGETRRLRSTWGTGADEAVIAIERPDVVLVLLTERALGLDPDLVLGRLDPRAPPLVAADVRATSAAWSLDRAPQGSLEVAGGAFTQDDDARVWTQSGALDRFVIDLGPAVERGRPIVVDLALDAPVAARLDLVGGSAGGEEWVRRGNVPVALAAGPNDELLVLPGSATGRLLVTFSKPGAWRIRRFEVRALEAVEARATPR